MKPSSKTPYEIRLELLQLAQKILSDSHAATAAKAAETNGGSVLVSTSPTSEEIIAEANKLNEFVSKANVVH